MRLFTFLGWSVVVFLVATAPAWADPPAPPTTPPPAPPPSVPVMPPPPATAVAVTVNGQPIMEIAVYRGLQRLPPERHAQARPELINFLVDNALIDQFLIAQKIAVDDKDVEAKFKQVLEEIKKQGMTFEELMKRFVLTEAELRTQICAQLRWEAFINREATDKNLRELFGGSQDIFDGSMVRARHILITPAAADPQSVEQARIRAASLKKQIEDGAAQTVAREPATGDALAMNQKRAKAIEDTFAAVAGKESMCPSKQQGGDLGFFPRAGSMVEPFAKAAFALPPYQVSDPVPTGFGHHLILVTERKPGKPVKFEEIKDEVKEVFGDRMRESLLAHLRPQAKILVNAPPK